jgi:hypothetical protein
MNASPPSLTTPIGGIVHIGSSAGHRSNYVETLCAVTGLEKSMAKASVPLIAKLLMSRKLLLATAEDNVGLFVVISILRRMMGKPTVSLVMGAGRCYASQEIKHVAKKLALQFLNGLNGVRLLSILPFYLDRRFADVTGDWIYDPQFWDLAPAIEAGFLPQSELAEAMLKAAAGRPILLFLGAPSGIKGFPFLSRIVMQDPSITEQLLIAVAGRVPAAFMDAKSTLAACGVWFADRYLTEEEVVSLKASSDTLWACYHPSYNSSSGLFGRALQFNKNVIVRRGSYLEAIAHHFAYPIEACDHDDDDAGLKVLRRIAAPGGLRRDMGLARQMHDLSVERLLRALGPAFVRRSPDA